MSAAKLRRGLIIGAPVLMCASCLVSFEDYPLAADGGGNAGASGSGFPDAAFGGSSGVGGDGSAGSAGTGGTPLDGSSECDADEACVAEAPAGWQGPIAFWSGEPGAAPSCPSEYSQSLGDASAEIIQGGCEQCKCSASCDVSAAVSGAPGCGDPATIWAPLGSTCSQVTAPSPSSVQLSAEPACTVEQPSVPAPLPSSFAKGTRACDLTETQQSCSEGACRPIPPNGFALCIRQPGDLPCPTPYGTRTVTYDSITLKRTCAACGCLASGSCDATVGVGANSCASTFKNCVLSAGCCDWNDDIASAYLQVLSSQGSQCSSTGGEVQGADTGAGAVTICCL